MKKLKYSPQLDKSPIGLILFASILVSQWQEHCSFYTCPLIAVHLLIALHSRFNWLDRYANCPSNKSSCYAKLKFLQSPTSLPVLTAMEGWPG